MGRNRPFVPSGLLKHLSLKRTWSMSSCETWQLFAAVICPRALCQSVLRHGADGWVRVCPFWVYCNKRESRALGRIFVQRVVKAGVLIGGEVGKAPSRPRKKAPSLTVFFFWPEYPTTFCWHSRQAKSAIELEPPPALGLCRFRHCREIGELLPNASLSIKWMMATVSQPA
jgi:hypothetical protein